MITEAEIIAALDEPRPLFAIQRRVAPGEKNTEDLQMILLRMRDENKVTFESSTGRWSRR